jgi:hypothetical protein
MKNCCYSHTPYRTTHVMMHKLGASIILMWSNYLFLFFFRGSLSIRFSNNDLWSAGSKDLGIQFNIFLSLCGGKLHFTAIVSILKISLEFHFIFLSKLTQFCCNHKKTSFFSSKIVPTLHLFSLVCLHIGMHATAQPAAINRKKNKIK